MVAGIGVFRAGPGTVNRGCAARLGQVNTDAPTSPPARAVAVVGGSRYLGAHLVGMLLRNESVERVLAIDSVKPSPQHRRRMRDAEFVRLDPQSPRLPGILREAEIDTVVHAGLFHTDFAPARAVKESNIMGSMHVIAAADGPRRSAVRPDLHHRLRLGGGPGHVHRGHGRPPPAQRRHPRSPLRRGIRAGNVLQTPDIDVTILRIPAISTTRTDRAGELLLPSVALVVAGFDPRIQLLHPQDALTRCCTPPGRGAGHVNIAPTASSR